MTIGRRVRSLAAARPVLVAARLDPPEDRVSDMIKMRIDRSWKSVMVMKLIWFQG